MAGKHENLSDSKRARNEQSRWAARKSPGLVIVLLAVGFVALMATSWKDRQRFLSVEVLGASPLSSSLVHATVDSLIAKQHREVTLAEVRSAVLQNPFVAYATVYCRGTNTLVVEIQERTPAALWVCSNGAVRYVDATGAVLPDVGTRYVHNVPVLHCSSLEGNNHATRKKAVQTLLALQSGLSSSLAAEISEFRVGSDNAITLVTTRHRWLLGCLQRVNTSDVVERIQAFWNRNALEPIVASAEEFDVRWRSAVIVRRKQVMHGA
jgi:cell division septal protein FtsQ